MQTTQEKKKEEENIRNVVILGSGPAGLTAGLYTGRANLNPLVLHGNMPGGQLTTTNEIENFPGIDGSLFIDNLTQQVQKFNVDFKYGEVIKVDLKQQPLKLCTREEVIETRTLIIATGARPKKLGIPSETTYWSKGVTSCATCDGFFYKGMDVCVIGGGDTACEEALYLTRMCNKVYLIHRRDKLRASKIMCNKTMNHPKIEIIWNSIVEEIVGGEKVNGIRIKNINTYEIKLIDVRGVFLAIGHIPNTEPFKQILDLDENGYLLTASHSTATNIPGVFAVGDCQDHIYRQAITAAGTGCMGAIESERWLENQNFN